MSSGDGPVHHIVLFRFKEGVEGNKLNDLLHSVRKNVPGLVELYFGQDVVDMYQGRLDRSASYNYGLVSRHVSRGALLEYIKHPEHVALAKYFDGFKIGSTPLIAIDFFTPSSRL